MERVLDGLDKFTSYFIKVRGKTSKKGNASKILNATTYEDSKYCVTAWGGIVPYLLSVNCFPFQLQINTSKLSPIISPPLSRGYSPEQRLEIPYPPVPRLPRWVSSMDCLNGLSMDYLKRTTSKFVADKFNVAITRIEDAIDRQTQLGSTSNLIDLTIPNKQSDWSEQFWFNPQTVPTLNSSDSSRYWIWADFSFATYMIRHGIHIIPYSAILYFYRWPNECS